MSCARHLANHNVNTLVFSSKLTQLTSTDLRQQLFDGELTLYSMCGNKIILDAQGMCRSMYLVAKNQLPLMIIVCAYKTQSMGYHSSFLIHLSLFSQP